MEVPDHRVCTAKAVLTEEFVNCKETGRQGLGLRAVLCKIKAVG